MAEKLSERLEDMGKDLTSMIEEVNGASATLSSSRKTDEPVCETGMIIVKKKTNAEPDFPNRPHPQFTPLPASAD